MLQIQRFATFIFEDHLPIKLLWILHVFLTTDGCSYDMANHTSDIWSRNLRELESVVHPKEVRGNHFWDYFIGHSR